MADQNLTVNLDANAEPLLDALANIDQNAQSASKSLENIEAAGELAVEGIEKVTDGVTASNGKLDDLNATASDATPAPDEGGFVLTDARTPSQFVIVSFAPYIPRQGKTNISSRSPRQSVLPAPTRQRNPPFLREYVPMQRRWRAQSHQRRGFLHGNVGMRNHWRH